MPIAKLDGLQTRYEVIGQGPPILMYAPGGLSTMLEIPGSRMTIQLADRSPGGVFS